MIRLAITHPPWALGVADEVWWSRSAPPDQHGWRDAASPLHRQERAPAKEDPDPKALACYGLRVRRRPSPPDRRRLRFVEGRPVSAVTIDFLSWCCPRLAAQGVTALLLVWDNASWHTSQAVRTWLRRPNQTVKQTGWGVCIVPCWLPAKSPWLNPLEPKWGHGKRAVSEPDRLLSAAEREARGCTYYGCTGDAHLLMPKKVA